MTLRAICGVSRDSPRRRARIVSSNSCSVTSFSRYPCAPARTASKTVSSSFSVVSTRTWVPGSVRVISRVAATPPCRGMCRSMSTISGVRRFAISTASIPSHACPTTSMSGSIDRSTAVPRRTSAWSSAIKIRTRGARPVSSVVMQHTQALHFRYHAAQPALYGSDFSHLSANTMTIDPRRSLVAGLIWLVVALALSFACAASLWAGRVAREIVVQQHVRRLLLETDQLASDLGQAVSARMAAARTVRAATPLPRTFAVLVAQYPDQGWIAVADETGTVIAGDGSFPEGTSVVAAPWFSSGRERPWIGIIESGADGVTGTRGSPLLGDLSLPLRDAAGHTLGVVAAHLTWRWATRDLRRLSAGLEPVGSAQT